MYWVRLSWILSPPSLFGLTTCFCGEFQSQRRTSRSQPSSHPRGVEFSFDPCGTKYGLRDLTSSGAVYMVPGRLSRNDSTFVLWGLHQPLPPVSVFQGPAHLKGSLRLYYIAVFGSPFSQIQFKEMTGSAQSQKYITPLVSAKANPWNVSMMVGKSDNMRHLPTF